MIQQQSSSTDLILSQNHQTLQIRLKSTNWHTRKQVYQLILFQLQKQVSTTSRYLFEIQGKPYEYTPKKLISFFKDIVDQQHPHVLLPALQCVELMLQKKLATGKQFIKLIDQGFDKFPLKINKSKQIQIQFLHIIQKISLDPQFIINKLNCNSHQKCIIFALEISGLLSMTSLTNKIRDISVKHPKQSVRQVAFEIYQQLYQLLQQQQTQDHQPPKKHAQKNTQIQIDEQQNKQFQQKQKKINKISSKSSNTNLSKQKQKFIFNKAEFQILQKISQFQQLNNKQQQKYCENLTNFFDKYYSLIKQSKTLPPLPLNQLTNLSYLIRIIIDSNNVIFSTNGLKLLKILIQNNNQLLPRSYPLLFIFQKYRLHTTHQINQLLYQVCDSLLLCNSMSSSRNIDLLYALGQGASNKKINIKLGCFMVFIRCVAILYNNQQLFVDLFYHQQQPSLIQLSDIYNKINQTSLDKILIKLSKYIVKNLQIFNTKLQDQKKYQSKLIKIQSIIYSNNSNNHIDNGSILNHNDLYKNKILNKKTYNQQTQKLKDHDRKTINPRTPTSNPKKTYKIINPQDKTNKILSICQNPTPNSIATLPKLTLQSIAQFQQCLSQHRFQLFYYTQIIQNFIKQYPPHQKTTQLISQYLEQLLLKLSTIKQQPSTKTPIQQKYFLQSLKTLFKICISQLILDQHYLQQILNNISNNINIKYIINSIMLLNEQDSEIKIKKKNKPIVISWLHHNIPHNYLSNQLLTIIQKIQSNIPLGMSNTKQHKYTTSRKQLKCTSSKSNKILSYQCQLLQNKFIIDNNNNLYHPQQQIKTQDLQLKIPIINYISEGNKTIKNQIINNQQCFQLSKNKSLLSNQNHQLAQLALIKKNFICNNQQQKIKQTLTANLQQTCVKHPNKNYQPSQNLTKKQQTQNQLPAFKTILSPQQHFSINQNTLTPLQLNPFQHSQISHISHIQQYQIGLHGSTDRQLLNQCNKYQSTNKNQKNNSKLILTIDMNQSQTDQQHHHHHLHQKQFNQSPKKKSNHSHQNSPTCKIAKQIYYDRSKNNDEQSQQNSNLDKYEQNILPRFSRQKQYKQQQSQHKIPQQPQQTKNHLQSTKITPTLSPSLSSQKPNSPTFQYKQLNPTKLIQIFQYSQNPYQSLKSSIITPFKQSQTKQYFLKQLNLFITSLPQIKQPQPYNSILLIIILLSSQIHSNRQFIKPLQQLYQYMSTLISTNKFIHTILSLFHLVIKQTPQASRTFLLTIITKSIQKLIPFCQNYLQLLKDLAYFYNIGQSIYFNIYQHQYQQICQILQGNLLHHVVQQALIQQGINLQYVVDSWFNTQFKNKVQEQIQIIIKENSQESNNNHH